jgi:hypothetical protein
MEGLVCFLAAESLGDGVDEAGGLYDGAEFFLHDAARAVVIEADGGNSGGDGFEKSESVAFVA